MIEFKAECGHTVRAKDEDAGGVVRCSYCGRNAPVPENRNADLDFLLSELPSSTEPATGGVRRRRRRWQLFRRRARVPGRFDVFSIIFRMCYTAALIAIVIIVARKYVIPLFDEGGVAERIAHRPGPVQRKSSAENPLPPPSSKKIGLTTLEGLTGIYVGSTPPGATAFCIEASKAPAKGRIHQLAGCVSARANGPSLRAGDGTYLVEVALAWNDPALNDPDLPTYQSYRAFRRAIESSKDEERIKLVEQFFVPDEASAVFVDQTSDQIYLIRQYRNVDVRSGQSSGVQALFLPRIVLPDANRFSIAQLVTSYLPKEKPYNFNEKQVRSELDFYDVPEADRLFVIEALSRIGVIPYVTPDGRTRLFKIGIHDGLFTTKVIREAKG